jgi:hypothetical protein
VYQSKCLPGDCPTKQQVETKVEIQTRQSNIKLGDKMDIQIQETGCESNPYLVVMWDDNGNVIRKQECQADWIAEETKDEWIDENAFAKSMKLLADKIKLTYLN